MSPSWSGHAGPRPCESAACGSSAWDDERIEPKLVTADELTSPYDLILLSVKATALAAAIDDMAPAVGPNTSIVPFLNGMAHVDVLNARFGAAACWVASSSSPPR